MRRQSGHTLVELVAVATVTSILMTIALRAARPMTATAVSQRDRAVASAELRLAVEALLADLGGAERLVRENESSLRIVREEAVARLADGWTGGSDPGIVYRLRKGQLMRDDRANRSRVIMARGLSEFSVDVKRNLGTAITIAVGEADNQRLTLVWTQ